MLFNKTIQYKTNSIKLSFSSIGQDKPKLLQKQINKILNLNWNGNLTKMT